MRHIRTRRRFKLLLAVLLGLSVLLFAESRIEYILPHLRHLLESKIEEALGGRFDVAIGAFKGGLLHPIALTDCSIRDAASGPSLVQTIDIIRIESRYRLWDILLMKRDRPVADSLLEDFSVDIAFATRHKDITGFARLEGGIADIRVKGYLNTPHLDRIDFTGKVINGSFELGIKPRDGLIMASGNLTEDGGLTVCLNANHIKLSGFDIVCDAVVRVRVADNGSDPRSLSLEGDLETKSLILNYKPFFDLKGSYKLSNGVLRIAELTIGNVIKADGRIHLRKPYSMHMAVTADNANVVQLLNTLGVSDPSSVLSGNMNARLELKGHSRKLRSVANIEIRNGTIGGLDFEYLKAMLKGEGPVIRIEESRITRSSGYFALGGEIDIRKIGKDAVFSNIKIVTSESALMWDSLDSSRMKDMQQLSLRKKMSDEVSLGFKKFITDNSIVDESIRDTDEIELEYKLHPNDSLKVMFGQESNFVGFEHKDRF